MGKYRTSCLRFCLLYLLLYELYFLFYYIRSTVNFLFYHIKSPTNIFPVFRQFSVLYLRNVLLKHRRSLRVEFHDRFECFWRSRGERGGCSRNYISTLHHKYSISDRYAFGWMGTAGMLLFALCEYEGEAEDIRKRGLSMIQWVLNFLSKGFRKFNDKLYRTHRVALFPLESKHFEVLGRITLLS